MLCLLALQPPGTRLWSLCQAAASAALMRVTRRCVAEHVPGTRACLLLPRTPTWQLPGSRATRCGACVLLYLRHQGLSSVWALTRKISRTIPRRNILTPQDVAAFDSLCALPQSSLFGFPGRSSADKYSRAQAAVSGKLMSALNRLALACACNAYWCPDHAHTTPHHMPPPTDGCCLLVGRTAARGAWSGLSAGSAEQWTDRLLHGGGAVQGDGPN
jgi:hypothetical protein